MTSAVSLVVTMKNERPSLESFLASVYSQSRMPDEIVIVDGGSHDGTAELLLDHERRLGGRLVVLQAPGTNIAAGRNIGIERARGPLLAITDAGTVLDRRWLEQLVAPLADTGTAVSSGFFEPGGTSWFERTLSTIITPQREDVRADSFLPSSRSVAFRKDWWQRVGGYPQWLQHCEDLVFDLALRDAGAEFAFAPDAVVSWTARSSLRAFFRQYFLYARGDGHARLWPQRHVARYTAYGLGLALVLTARRRPVLLVPLVGGTAIHLRRYAARLLRHPPHVDRLGNILAIAALPGIVATGDVAKMAGYPVGRFERTIGRVAIPAERTST